MMEGRFPEPVSGPRGDPYPRLVAAVERLAEVHEIPSEDIVARLSEIVDHAAVVAELKLDFDVRRP